MSDWEIPCPICGKVLDSHDSYGDTRPMVRDHTERVHGVDYDAYMHVRRTRSDGGTP